MFSALPFSNKTETQRYPIYEKIKMTLMIITLLPFIRLILFFLTSGLLLVSLILTHLCYKIYKNNKISNMSPIRRFFYFLNQKLARSCLFILGYYWINESFEDKKCCTYPSYLENNKTKIIICNHISFLDSLYFMSRGSYYFLASAALRNNCLYKFILESMGAIFVPTNENEKDIFKNPNEIINDIINSENINRPILIFPEGAVKQNNYLFNFQLGAFRPLKPIRPIILNYNNKYCDPSWTYSHGMLFILFRLCCQFINFLEVKYLKIYEPNISQTPIEFKNILEKAYLEKSQNLVKINLSVNDSFFYRKLYQKNKKLADYAYRLSFR